MLGTVNKFLKIGLYIPLNFLIELKYYVFLLNVFIHCIYYEDKKNLV